MSGFPANQGRRPERIQPIAGAIGWSVLAGTAPGTSDVLNFGSAERVPFRWPIRVGPIGMLLSVVTLVPDLYSWTRPLTIRAGLIGLCQ